MLGNGREAVEFAPVTDATKKNAKEFPFLMENLVLKGSFSKDSKPSGQSLGLMQLTETCASLYSDTSAWC